MHRTRTHTQCTTGTHVSIGLFLQRAVFFLSSTLKPVTYRSRETTREKNERKHVYRSVGGHGKNDGVVSVVFFDRFKKTILANSPDRITIDGTRKVVVDILINSFFLFCLLLFLIIYFQIIRITSVSKFN